MYLYSRFSLNKTYTSDTLSNENSFYWDLYYDIYNNKIRRKSCIKRDYNPKYNLTNKICIKKGFYEEGDYYIINKTLNKVLAFSVQYI